MSSMNRVKITNKCSGAQQLEINGQEVYLTNNPNNPVNVDIELADRNDRAFYYLNLRIPVDDLEIANDWIYP